MRVLIVEDEVLLANAVDDGLRFEVNAADVVGDGDIAREAPSVDSDGLTVIGAETSRERAWDESAGPFTDAVRVTLSSLRQRLGEPWLIATVPGVGYRIEAGSVAAADAGAHV